MPTITKKEMIERIAAAERVPRSVVKNVVQAFLNGIISELDHDNRLEFRDFGIFECHHRPARIAQNPRTLVSVAVPCKRKVRFKPSRFMRKRMMDVKTAATQSDGRGSVPAGAATTAAAVQAASKPAAGSSGNPS